MDCFLVNLNSTFKISLSGKEHLIPPRRHLSRRTDCYIMYFVTEGRLSIMLDGRRFELGKGDIYIFDKGAVHEPFEETECNYFYIHYECDAKCMVISQDEFLESVRQRNKKFLSYDVFDTSRYEQLIAFLPRYIHIKESDMLEYLIGEFKKLKLMFGGRGIEHSLEISHGISSLFLRLERFAIDDCISQRDKYALNMALAKRIADHIEENYTKEIRSSDIEKRFSISYDHANRIFKHQKGMSIISYRNKLRIDRAKVLLATTNKTVEEISIDTGFCDKYYFSKFFKKAVGISPTHFRRSDAF